MFVIVVANAPKNALLQYFTHKKSVDLSLSRFSFFFFFLFPRSMRRIIVNTGFDNVREIENGVVCCDKCTQTASVCYVLARTGWQVALHNHSRVRGEFVGCSREPGCIARDLGHNVSMIATLCACVWRFIPMLHVVCRCVCVCAQ